MKTMFLFNIDKFVLEKDTSSKNYYTLFAHPGKEMQKNLRHVRMEVP